MNTARGTTSRRRGRRSRATTRARVGEAEVGVQLQAVGGDGRTRHFSRSAAENQGRAHGDDELRRAHPCTCRRGSIAREAPCESSSTSQPPGANSIVSSQSTDPKPKHRYDAVARHRRASRRAPARARRPGCGPTPDRGAAARAVSGGARGGADASRAAAACGGSSRRDQTRRADSKVTGAAASGGSARPWKSANSVLPTPAHRFDQTRDRRGRRNRGTAPSRRTPRP